MNNVKTRHIFPMLDNATPFSGRDGPTDFTGRMAEATPTPGPVHCSGWLCGSFRQLGGDRFCRVSINMRRMSGDMRRGRRVAGSSSGQTRCGTTSISRSRMGSKRSLTSVNHLELATNPCPRGGNRTTRPFVTRPCRLKERKHSLRAVGSRQRNRVVLGQRNS